MIELLGTLPPAAQRAQLLKEAQALKARVDAKAPGAEVTKLAASLRWRVIEVYNVTVAPKSAPDLKRGAALYAAQCAACHGAQGRGDGPAAKGLDPAPANFHNRERMAQRSLYGLYNTITLGVAGTSMSAFGHLTEGGALGAGIPRRRTRARRRSQRQRRRAVASGPRQKRNRHHARDRDAYRTTR